MYLRGSARLLIALALTQLETSRPPGALAEVVNARIVPAPSDDPDTFGTSNFWVVAGNDNVCTLRRITFRDTNCNLHLEFQHGGSGITCGAGNDWRGWYWTSGTFFGAAMSTTGTTRRIALPKHAEMRRMWIGPVDQEGIEHAGYPINGDIMVDWYPRRILKSVRLSQPHPINPLTVVSQAVTYRTMHGQSRTFVGARIAFAPGAELTIYRWVEPSKAAEATRAGQLLMTVSLVDVADSPADAKAEACRRPVGR